MVNSAADVSGGNSRLDPRYSFGWTLTIGGFAAVAALLYLDGILEMQKSWHRSEYSHGFLIPLISGYLIWRRRDSIASVKGRPSYWGVAIILLSLVLLGFGEISATYLVVQVSLLLTIVGLSVSLIGFEGTKIIRAPLTYLIFMIPLPAFLQTLLSSELQLLSSELGVAMIRWFGISVYLEGNIIDLGSYKLQVVEACDGLRYLFPLMSFAFLLAYIFEAPWWQRLFLFLSAVPITLVMNVARIAAIGIVIEQAGTTTAAGFQHYFEGWVVFVVCVLVLLFEMWLLPKVFVRSPSPAPAADRTSQDSTTRAYAAAHRRVGPMRVGAMALIVALVIVQFVDNRTEATVARKSFASFPMTVGTWQGRRSVIDPIVQGALAMNDYLAADFVNRGGAAPIAVYAAYYASQRKGGSVHSPRSCIPGGGWEITDFSNIALDTVQTVQGNLKVNRVLISRGRQHQIVYYWFQQRHRRLTNEYAVKYFLFVDAIMLNRTDGALIRVSTPIFNTERTDAADRRLRAFVETIYPEMLGYFPI